MKTLKIILCIATALSIAAFALAIYYTQFYKDVVPPQISMDSDTITVSVTEGDEALLRGVTAADNRDGDISGSVIVDSVSQLTGINSARVRYIVFDKAENYATASRTVIYSDYRAPQIIIQKPLVFNTGDVIALRGKVLARDCLEGNITSMIRLSSRNLNNKAPGTYHLTIWVMNRLGDVSTVDVPVIIRDENPQAPIIELTDYLVYLERGDAFDPKTYFRSYFENDSNLLHFSYDKLDVTGEVDTDTPGTYEVSYSATNRAGLTSEVILTVVVEEKMEGQS